MSDTASHPATAVEGPAQAGPMYQRYALTLLMVIYALNMLDRQIVTILAEPLKQDLGLTDGQLGAITGLAFAIFYTSLGLPIARLADRADRVWLISGSLVIWSAFTMLCGLARTFPQLLLARLGVGFGEAGCTPAAHSLISDATPRHKLASALAFYSLGIPLGSLLGLAMGGMVAEAFGWRVAFMLAGAPGLVIGALALATLRDPRRNLPKRAAAQTQVSLAAAMAELRSKPSFWWVSLAAGAGSLVFYSQTAFLGSLFLRVHGPEIERLGAPFGLGATAFLGLAMGLILGAGSGLGTYLGGQLADRASRRGVRGYTQVPMMAFFFSTPFFIVMDLSGDAVLALACLAPAAFMHAMAYGSGYAAIQSVVSPGVRATAAAVNLFVSTTIGLGIGPLAVGVLSDALAKLHGPAGGLQLALALSTSMLVVAAGCFVLAGRTIARDEHVPPEVGLSPAR